MTKVSIAARHPAQAKAIANSIIYGSPSRWRNRRCVWVKHVSTEDRDITFRHHILGEKYQKSPESRIDNAALESHVSQKDQVSPDSRRAPWPHWDENSLSRQHGQQQLSRKLRYPFARACVGIGSPVTAKIGIRSVMEGRACRVRLSEGPACQVRRARFDHPSRFIGHDRHAPPIFPSTPPFGGTRLSRPPLGGTRLSGPRRKV